MTAQPNDRRTTDADVTTALALWRRQEAAAAVAAFPQVSDTIVLSEFARRLFVDAIRATERSIGRAIGVGDPLHSALSLLITEAYQQGRVAFALNEPGVAATWEALEHGVARLDEPTRDALGRCFLRLCRLARAHEAARARRRHTVTVPVEYYKPHHASLEALRDGFLSSAQAWRLGELSAADLEDTVRRLSHGVYTAGYACAEGVWKLAIQQWDDLDAEDAADDADVIDR